MKHKIPKIKSKEFTFLKDYVSKREIQYYAMNRMAVYGQNPTGQNPTLTKPHRTKPHWTKPHWTKPHSQPDKTPLHS